MILAVCVDDGLGLQFNRRRQSRDAAVRRDLLELSGGRLYMSRYTAHQFEDSDPIVASDDYLALAAEGEWVFAEDCEYLNYVQKIEKIVLYRWNRNYPRDLCFRFPGQWRLAQTTDLAGVSHETVTREVYIP